MPNFAICDLLIRPFQKSDYEIAYLLSAIVGWGNTKQDWIDDFEFSKGMAYVAFYKDELVGIAFAFPFDSKVRIGNVIVHPSFRRKGIGSKLVEVLIQELRKHNFQDIELSASIEGYPIYKKLGFLPQYELIAWTCTSPLIHNFQAPSILKASSTDLDPLIKLDKDTFGDSRIELFHKFIYDESKTIFVDKNTSNQILGFIICSAEREGIRIGPIIHESIKGAERLLDAAIHDFISHNDPRKIFIHSMACHDRFSHLLQKKGFLDIYTSTQMYLGGSTQTSKALNKYFAIWSLAYG